VDVANGGGAVYNQAAHPLDVLRLLGGGMIKSVRGATVDTGLAGRPCPGYFTAFLEFEDGTPATFVYDGYGYIGGWELTAWGETPGRLRGMESSYAYRRALRAGTADEYEARELLRFGGRPAAGASGGGEGGGGEGGGWTPQDAGLVIATCELGEIRQSRTGLYVYDDEGRHDQPIGGAASNRHNEVAELRDAIAGLRRPLHDGYWGKATIEVLQAILQSAAEHREIELQYQVSVRD
jgi:phthalate 4,5-cis-dihydrodiol dehydrogenase